MHGDLPSSGINEGEFIPPIPRLDSTFAPSISGDYGTSTPTTPAIGAATPDVSNPFLAPAERAGDAGMIPKEEATENTPMTGGYPAASKTKRPLWQYLAVASAVIIIVVLAVILPVYFTVIKPHHDNSSSDSSSNGGSGGSNGGGSSSNPESPSGAVTGGNGSMITTADNVTFMYINNFGGFCTYIRSLNLPWH